MLTRPAGMYVLGGRFGASEAGTCWYGEKERCWRGCQLAVGRHSSSVEFMSTAPETDPVIKVNI